VPFTLAVFLPIHNSIVVKPREIVTFFSVPSQPTVPPRASTIGRIGRRVLPFLMIGGESKVFGEPFTVNEVCPTLRTITI
jgi:hypothetical protein